MKQYLLPTVLAAILFASCSSAYKSGQTPDDVYYSPTRFVKEEEKRDEQKDSSTTEDRYLRMKARNYSKWSNLDDYTYWNDARYNHYCNCTCYNSYYTTTYWGSSFYTNFWQTPFYYYNPIKQPVRYTGNTSGTNILAYKNKTYTNDNASYNPKLGNSTSSNSSFGNLVKKAFSTKNGTTTSWDTPARTFGSSSSSSSSSSSGTSSSAGGRSGGFSSKGSTPRSGRN
jgi:uncharacterized membrane protein YgcG